MSETKALSIPAYSRPALEYDTGRYTIPKGATKELTYFISDVAFQFAVGVADNGDLSVVRYLLGVIAQYAAVMREYQSSVNAAMAQMNQEIVRLNQIVQQKPQAINITLPQMTPVFNVDLPEISAPVTVNVQPRPQGRLAFEYDRQGNIISANPESIQ